MHNMTAYGKKDCNKKKENRIHVGELNYVYYILYTHLYSHKPYTTVQRRHKYTYNKYRIDINIYTVYTTKTWV